MNFLKGLLDSFLNQLKNKQVNFLLCASLDTTSMENFDNSRKKQHLREVLLYHFFLGKAADEAHQLLVECYGEHSLSERQCLEWFQRFESGDYDVRDKERPGQKRKFTDEELEKLLDEDPFGTQEELATALNVSEQAVSIRMDALGLVQNDEKN